MNKSNLPIANPFLRLIAWLIEASLSVVVTLMGVLLVSQSTTPVELIPTILLAVGLAWLLFPLVFVFVNPYLMAHFGGGVGKLATGLAVVNEEGQYLSYWRAIFRNTVGYVVSNVFFSLGFIWILVDKQRQGWHDQVVGSYVRVSQKMGLVTGLVVLGLLLILCSYLVSQTVANFEQNQSLYKEVMHSLAEEETPVVQPEATPAASPSLRY